MGQQLIILIRPEAADLQIPDLAGYTELKARIKEKSFRGRYQEVTFEIEYGGETAMTLEFDFDTDVSLPPDSVKATLYIDPAGTIILED